MTDEQPKTGSLWAKLALAAGVSCAAVCGPFVVSWESGGRQHLDAYHGQADAPGVWTICNGDTLGVKAGDRESATGCAVRTDARLAAFVKPVLACSPGLYGHPYQLAAAISLAYNIGAKAYCGSTVDRRFDARRWAAACDAFLLWNKANGRVVAGLANRRMAERSLCLKDLPA